MVESGRLLICCMFYSYRGFESLLLLIIQILNLTNLNIIWHNPINSMGTVVQLVRAPPCHGGSCGFESRQSRIANYELILNSLFGIGVYSLIICLNSSPSIVSFSISKSTNRSIITLFSRIIFMAF